MFTKLTLLWKARENKKNSRIKTERKVRRRKKKKTKFILLRTSKNDEKTLTTVDTVNKNQKNKNLLHTVSLLYVFSYVFLNDRYENICICI